MELTPSYQFHTSLFPEIHLIHLPLCYCCLSQYHEDQIIIINDIIIRRSKSSSISDSCNDILC